MLEQAAPLFTGGLTIGNIEDIEDVQKAAFKIILRKDYVSYEQALEVLGEETLEERRKMISIKFAKKCSKHPKLEHLFKRNENSRTRRAQQFTEPRTFSARGDRNPVKYLIQLLNKSNL